MVFTNKGKNTGYKNKIQEKHHTHFNKQEWTLGFKDFDFSEI